MKVLVTGSSGVAGQALKAMASQFNHEFLFATTADCDLRDAKATNEFFAYHRFEGVINFAAVSGGIGLSGPACFDAQR